MSNTGAADSSEWWGQIKRHHSFGSFSKIHPIKRVYNVEQSNSVFKINLYNIAAANKTTNSGLSSTPDNDDYVLKLGTISDVEQVFHRLHARANTSFIEHALGEVALEMTLYSARFSNGLLFRRANSDLSDFLRTFAQTYSLKREHTRLQRKHLFTKLANFMQECVGFLHSDANRIIFCDWKPENVLVRYPTTSAVTAESSQLLPTFTLTDFGSACVAAAGSSNNNNETPRMNPNNVNVLFGSPFLAPCFETIQPNFFDDYFSMQAMFVSCLADRKPPWVSEVDSAPTHILSNTNNLNIEIVYKKLNTLFKIDTYMTAEDDVLLNCIWPTEPPLFLKTNIGLLEMS